MPQPKSPVVPGLEEYEIIFGENRTDVIPLPALRSKGPTYSVYSRWVLTPAERVSLIDGADIYLIQDTYGHPFQPSALLISQSVNNGAAKEVILQELGLDEELNERLAKVVDTFYPR